MSFNSQGTIFYWSTSTAATTNVAVGEVKSFSGPGGSANVIDASHLGSTAKEKKMGLPDEGQITLECNLLTSAGGQSALRADRSSRTKRAFLLALSDPSSCRVTGKGYCTGFSISGAVDDLVKASVTIEITGAVTWSTV